MEYKIPAKPTRYNGRLYRSRLEAKWQCMFNKMGWSAEYEPCEIGRYNPDFIIKCDSRAYAAKTIIVEIKPSPFITETLIADIYEKYKTTNSHILLLSESPFYFKKNDDLIHIGVGSQYYSGTDMRSDMQELQMKSVDDFGSMNDAFDGMVRGTVERKIFLTYRDIEYETLLSMWASCGNITQFIVK
jgi:hypothetical protein